MAGTSEEFTEGVRVGGGTDEDGDGRGEFGLVEEKVSSAECS